MDSFYGSFGPDFNGLSGQQSEHFGVLLDATLKNTSRHGDWQKIQILVEMSRQETWRRELKKFPNALQQFFNDSLWQAEPSSRDLATPERLEPCLRLLANICIEDFDIQETLELGKHVKRAHNFMNNESLFPLGVGLLTNILNEDDPVITPLELVQDGFHVTITKQVVSWKAPKNGLYTAAFDILETLAEEDAAAKSEEIDRALSTQALDFLVRVYLLPAEESEPSLIEDEQTLRIILCWAAIEEVQQNCNKDVPRLFMSGYVNLVKQLDDEIDEDTKGLLERCQTVLGDMSYSYSPDLRDEPGGIFEEAYSLARSKSSYKQGQWLVSTAYLILGNILRKDELAIAAVEDYKLHEYAAATLAKDEWDSAEVRNLLAAFIANLCIPDANKLPVLRTHVARTLFFDAKRREPALAVHIIRKFVHSRTKLDEWAKMLSITDVKETEELGVLSIYDLKTVLPPQNKLTKDIPTLQQSQNSAIQITIDVGRIVACMLRAKCPTEFIDAEIVQCLINLIRLGYRYRNFQDASEGLFGLALSLEREPGTLPHALEAVQSDSFKPMSTAIELGKSGAHPMATYDARNAMLVLAKLAGTAGEGEGESAQQEIKRIMSMWKEPEENEGHSAAGDINPLGSGSVNVNSAMIE